MGTPGHLPHQLEEWWERGEGAKKIRWGTPGDFKRCVRLAHQKGILPAEGFCANRHHGATGTWPGGEGKGKGAKEAVTTDFGGNPKPGTKPDGRLHENNGAKKKKKNMEGDEIEEFKAPPFPPKDDAAPPADGKKKCPPGYELDEEGECVKAAADSDVVTMGVDEELAAEVIAEVKVEPSGAWEGVLAVEGIVTGDGREFAPGALRWADLPVSLTYQPPTHGGQSGDGFVVGNIEDMWRDGAFIRGKGKFDIENPAAADIMRQVQQGFLKGVSVDVDDVGAAIELVWPENEGEPAAGEENGDILSTLFASPEKMIFHDGRIRGAALVTIPAFVEAKIWLADSEAAEAEEAQALAASAALTATHGAVPTHETMTTDASWDINVAKKRLFNGQPIPVNRAREAFAYVHPSDPNTDTALPEDCLFLHHEIGEDGSVGAANLTACASAVGALQSSALVPDDERRMIWQHVATHLRAAGREPPPLIEEIVASADPDFRPPADWFADPQLSVPTSITVDDKGRLYGHAAQWGECHIGFTDLCVTPPHESGHPYFMTGELICADGSHVAVGQITLGTGHAPLHLGASSAHEHYDNTGTAVADVTVGNDAHGIWVAGAVRSNAEEFKVRELRASGQVSGDWRRIGGQLRLVGLLAVNVPGFPVPRLRARVASGAAVSLVAAGKPTIQRPEVVDADSMRRALRVAADRVAASVGRARPDVAIREALAARVHGGK